MNPATHFLASWTLAARFGRTSRERLWITLAGVAPDLDGLGLVADVLNHAANRPDTDWFSRWHHVLFHGGFGALLVALVAIACGCRRPAAVGWILAGFHLHLLCDVVGSRGPGPGDVWPLRYLAPFAESPSIAWQGQWALNGWPNVVFTLVLLAWTIRIAITRGISPVSLCHARLDAEVVAALRRRWDRDGIR